MLPLNEMNTYIIENYTHLLAPSIHAWLIIALWPQHPWLNVEAHISLNHTSYVLLTTWYQPTSDELNVTHTGVDVLLQY